MDQGVYACSILHVQAHKNERSSHMIHIDELTERDRCCYRRGEMREYVRNHNPVPEDLRHELYLWVCSGHSVHENPWGLMDWRTGLQHDYLAAAEIRKTIKK